MLPPRPRFSPAPTRPSTARRRRTCCPSPRPGPRKSEDRECGFPAWPPARQTRSSRRRPAWQARGCSAGAGWAPRALPRPGHNGLLRGKPLVVPGIGNRMLGTRRHDPCVRLTRSEGSICIVPISTTVSVAPEGTLWRRAIIASANRRYVMTRPHMPMTSMLGFGSRWRAAC
jgi:hypothetical protein